ncbi:uncharacterized protein K444DRAFT_630214 [Hyaloscypha bicolor E]|uniref:Uncharacterized protein n=1 Tax=Hyaloscypha bicolor E TaxID=1095630 RepID=A0A2J6T8T3_9HELO|nr:uncharacterized protein K444DRAFT_630214 [Hyaloscypha bicolor E]PMD59434.1 hypothetical protein K444DRAFT_630214 [Hyaloscypha bicolor E]
MAEDSNRRKAGGMNDSSDRGDARTGGIGSNDKIVSESRHKQAIPPNSLQRATSCDSMFQIGRRRQPQSSLSPLVSWDDTSLINRHHVAPMSYVEDSVSIHQPGAVLTSRIDDSASTHKPQTAPTFRSRFSTLISQLRVAPTSNFEDLLAAIRENQRKTTLSGAALEGEENRRQMDKIMADPAQMSAAQMGIIIRRTQNINAFDGPRSKKHSDAEQFSGFSSPAESDSEVNFAENRLLHPDEYFQELDDLGSVVFQKSMFHFYTDGTVGAPFDGTIRFKASFVENLPFQKFSYNNILDFCLKVASSANEDSVGTISGVGGHYTNHQMYHRAIEDLNHLIECRNIISAVWESLQQMRSIHYCEEFISLIVLDSTRAGLARLVRIERSRIEQLALTFETCLFQVMSQDPVMVLFGNVSELSKELTIACQELLLKLDVMIPGAHDRKDIWRCVVHVLDMAVLSYTGAHTQFLGSHTITSVSLPGPFQEVQRYRFCRRSFSCLDGFLRGQQAWVLEVVLPGIFEVNPPLLSLLTDAETFGDIWGPMWKSYALGEEERIVQYNVGNGVILPWKPQSPTSSEVRKGEVFCHWMADEDRRDDEGSADSTTLRPNDTLLIGAPVTLAVNGQCESSFIYQKQSLRDSGALSEPGTIRNGRILSSELVRVQVGGRYANFEYTRKHKRREQTLKQCLIEDWKHNSQSRKVRHLEFKLGLEVSTCTRNARRVRLIELLGTRTMRNHLQNGSFQWHSKDCEESFYSAIQDQDYTAFHLSNAIEYCLDALKDTGKNEKDLEMFWAPDEEPGLKVTLKSTELSWIGFLEETATSGTLAVLEDLCLELSILDIGKKCQNAHFDPRHIGSNTFTPERACKGSILETSVQLNQLYVPSSISGANGRRFGYDSSPPKYDYFWSLSSLKEGDSFSFGQKGSLEVITALNQGQILAKWIKPKVISKVLGSSQTPREHYECIRDENEKTSPVHFFILSNAPSKVSSGQYLYRPSSHANSSSVGSGGKEYTVDFSKDGQPRTGINQTVIPQDRPDALRDIFYGGEITNSDAPENMSMSVN